MCCFRFDLYLDILWKFTLLYTCVSSFGLSAQDPSHRLLIQSLPLPALSKTPTSCTDNRRSFPQHLSLFLSHPKSRRWPILSHRWFRSSQSFTLSPRLYCRPLSSLQIDLDGSWNTHTHTYVLLRNPPLSLGNPPISSHQV